MISMVCQPKCTCACACAYQCEWEWEFVACKTVLMCSYCVRKRDNWFSLMTCVFWHFNSVRMKTQRRNTFCTKNMKKEKWTVRSTSFTMELIGWKHLWIQTTLDRKIVLFPNLFKHVFFTHFFHFKTVLIYLHFIVVLMIRIDSHFI